MRNSMSKDFIFTIIVIFILNGVCLLYFFQINKIPEIEEAVIPHEELIALMKEEKEIIEEQIVVEIASEPRLVDNPIDYLPEGKNYARVIGSPPIYSSPEARSNFRMQDSDIAWVNVNESTVIDGQRFYNVNWGWGASGWILEQFLDFSPILSRLKGVEIEDRMDEHLAIVYIGSLNVRSFPGDMREEALVGRIKRYDLVSVQEKERVGGDVWYKIDESQWIHGGYVRNLIPGKRPAGVGKDDKWIEINLSEQTIFAHEGDTTIYATLTSTGRYGRETITGLFWSRVKTRFAPMQGTEYSYDFADIPWIYYFSGDYAWHGVYWHDNFGTVQSSGCVNLSPHDAHWFFHWSDPELLPGQREVSPFAGKGTWVYVHY